jgi:uncharacterized protein YjbI with pentapeptide repeats
VKLEILAIAALITTVVAAPAKAENPEQLRQLLETNACRGCDLSDAQLNGAILIGADLSNARLRGAKLTGAGLRDAQLDGANLANTNLAQADLSGANLSNADLSGAKLSASNLTGANLSNANLTKADLSNANLNRASLSNTNLSNANLTGSIGLTSQSIPVINEAANSLQGNLSTQTPSQKKTEEPPSQSSGLSGLEERRTEDLQPQPLNTPQIEDDPATTTRPSPLERPPTRLFGFETGNSLLQKELVLQFGGVTYNNPDDFRDVLFGDGNRSNDAFVRVDYGITDDLQFTLGLAGKDDTIFSNLVGDQTSLQFIYGIIPAQIKWEVYDRDRFNAAIVGGVEFAAPFGPLFFTGDREITFTTSANPVDPNRSEFVAEDDSVYFSLATPVSYQLNEQTSFHLNPQVSFFPSSISARQTQGNSAALTGAGVGFDGDELDYYGTVFGIGFGVNYSLTPRIQFAAEVTPILTGLNSAGSGGDDSLFVARPVWSAGFKFAANSRVGANLYVTNRFGPIASAPSNILAQPGGDWGVGLDFTYLPDLTGSYELENRATYPEPEAFLSPLNGFPSTTLPINSVLYQLAFGSNLRINPNVRIGLLDDLELAINFSYADNTEEMPIEGSIFGRLALLPDTGRALSAAIDLGLTRIAATNRNLDPNTFLLQADLPVTYRLPDLGLSFTATPKVLVPAQFQGLDSIFGLTLGATWSPFRNTQSPLRNTQFLAQVTPVLLGDNELQESSIPGRQIPLQGKAPIFNVGVRQLFPAGNSLYALDLYVGNSVGDYGLQGISALPDGDLQAGVRFNVLNGVP